MAVPFTNHDLISGAISTLVKPTLDQIIRLGGSFAGQRQGDVYKFSQKIAKIEIGAEIEGPNWGVWRGDEQYHSHFRRGIFQSHEPGKGWEPIDELGFVALSGIVESLRDISNIDGIQG